MSEDSNKQNEIDEPNESENTDPAIDGEAQANPPCEAQLEEMKKQYLYLRADFENFRRQSIKERSELIKFGSEPVLREFLSVLDNLERASDTAVTADTLDQYKNGVGLIVNQLKKSLEKFGVEEVDCKGQTFDPNVHEALSSSNNPDLPPNSITDVFKKAYKLHGKVIRPAQVVVNTTTKEQ